MTNIITACFGGTRYTNTRPAWLIDHGMVLQIKGVELPETYEVDFSNSKAETATRVLGGADGVVIPDQYFLSNAPQIFAWVYLTTGSSGFTTLQITIPLTQRPDVSTEPPTPQETDLIEQAIAALNDGVERAETAADDAEEAVANIQQTVDDALQAAKDSGEFDGKDGVDGVTFTPDVDAAGNISWTNDGGLPNPQTRNIMGPAGKDGEDGEVGATPNLTIGTVETLEPGEDATAEITGTAENPVLNLGIPQGEQGEGADTSNYAPVIINSASGAIASFADGANGFPIKALSVNVEPIQDLHGYDSPWPAGGGVNKFNVDAIVQSDNITVSNGVISVTGQSVNSGKTLGQLANLTVGETYLLTATTTGTANYIYLISSGNSWYFGTQRTITETDLKSNVRFYSGAVGQTIQISNMMVRLASESDATFAPYSNICHISGRTSATIYHSGADTSDPTTYTIQLGDTVYGGTLDLTGGKMVVDRAYKLLNDADKWETAAGTVTYRYNEEISRKLYDNSYTGLTCTIAPTISNANYTARWQGATVYYFGIADKATTPVTSLDAIKAMATAGQIAICYAIEPVEITLTPTQIDTLLGTNNIWSDAGTVDVDYSADTKLYIDNIHTPTDDDMTADAQIASGKYFLIGGNLYKATTVIPAGDTIRPGTNCVKTNLAEALNALNA